MIAARFNQGQDLKQAICEYVVSQQLTSASVVSAVGSLSNACIRMAGAQPNKQDVRTYTGGFEIVSLIGTIDYNGKAHLHISFSDSEGNVIGGHVKDGCIIHTTVELTLLESPHLTFERVVDPQTGFDELTITESKN